MIRGISAGLGRSPVDEIPPVISVLDYSDVL